MQKAIFILAGILIAICARGQSCSKTPKPPHDDPASNPASKILDTKAVPLSDSSVKSVEIYCLVKDPDGNTHLYEREVSLQEPHGYGWKDYGWKELLGTSASTLNGSIWIDVKVDSTGSAGESFRSRSRTVSTGAGFFGRNKGKQKPPTIYGTFTVCDHGAQLQYEPH
jgi:hypothetical protein